MPQGVWMIAKSLKERDEPKALTEIRGPLSPKFLPVRKRYREY
jgi:hypothetical protein